MTYICDKFMSFCVINLPFWYNMSEVSHDIYIGDILAIIFVANWLKSFIKITLAMNQENNQEKNQDP